MMQAIHAPEKTLRAASRRLAALLAMVAVLPGGDAVAHIEIRADPDHLLPGETLQVRFAVVNDGAAPLVVPNPRAGLELPVYRLQGPDGVGDVTRSNRGGGVMTDDPRQAEPASLAVPAGGRWDGEIPLGAVDPPGVPGVYALSAAYALPSGWVGSNETVLRIAEWSAHALQAGYGTAPGDGSGAMLSATADGFLLYSFAFAETRPDLGEAAILAVVPRRRLPADAADAAVPVRNTGFHAELSGVVLWREGGLVVVLDDTGATAELHPAPAVTSLVMPPLWPAGGPVEVFALGPQRRSLSLLRFPRGGSPGIAWTQTLPFAAASAAAALSPGSQAAALVTGETGGGLGLAVLRPDGAPSSTITLPGVTALTGASPGVFVSPDGTVRAAVIALRGGVAHLIETVIEPSGAHHTGTDIAFDGPAPPLGGAVLYSGDAAGGLRRREAVLELDGGALAVLRDTGPAYTVRAAALPGSPFALVPGQDHGYIIRLAPQSGPRIDGL